MTILRENVRNLTIKDGGTPSFTSETWKSAQVRGYPLRFNESRMGFGIIFTDFIPIFYPSQRGALQPDETQNLYDLVTGNIMPYTIPAGHELLILELCGTANQARHMRVFWDGFLVSDAWHLDSYTPMWEELIWGISSRIFDPTMVGGHTLTFDITNDGSAPLIGDHTIQGVLIDHESEKITDKLIICKKCKHEFHVPFNTVLIKCPNPKCKVEYRVFAYNWLTPRKMRRGR